MRANIELVQTDRQTLVSLAPASLHVLSSHVLTRPLLGPDLEEGGVRLEAIGQESEAELLAALRLVVRTRAISHGRTRFRPKFAVSAFARARSLLPHS
jgi:hypothetical protein